MGTKGTRFSMPKYWSGDSLAFVTCAKKFHLNLKPRCIICFWAFWTAYLLDCFKPRILGSFWNLTSFSNNFVQFQVVLAELWAFRGMWRFCSWFLDNDLLLQIMRLVLIWSSSSTHGWKAIQIALLLVVFYSILSCVGRIMTVSSWLVKL